MAGMLRAYNSGYLCSKNRIILMRRLERKTAK